MASMSEAVFYMVLGAIIAKNPDIVKSAGKGVLDVVSVVGQYLEDHPDEYEELLKLLTPQDSQLAGGGSE